MQSNSFIKIVTTGIALGLCHVGIASPKAPPIKTTTISFHGWTNCTEISNGIVEAVIVPQIGRIMSFHFVDQPESDPLYINRDWVGKTGADAPAGTWANFGGDKLWPSEQANWPEYIGHTWPPDPAFDGVPQQLTDIPNGVELTTPTSDPFGATATRTITIHPGEARLYISQVLSRVAAPSPVSGVAATPSSGFSPIGIWSITQTRADATLFFPLSRSSNFPNGVITFDSNSRPVDQIGPMPPGWTELPDMLIGHLDPVNAHKFGTDSQSGWVASLYNDDILFSEHYNNLPHEHFPDRGCRNEVYNNPGDNPYIEFEILGPVQPLNAGQKETYDIYWQLDRLNRKPTSNADAAKLVQQAMKTKKTGTQSQVFLSP